MSGFIQLHRQLLDSYHFANPENLKIWVWMLLKANYKDKEVSVNVGTGYSDISIKRGQFIFGRTSAAKELKMHESKIYRVIKKFEKDGSIEVKSNNKYSIITICKYDDYNKNEIENEQQVNNRRTTGEQQVNATNKDNKVNKGKIKDNNNSLPAASDGIYSACMKIYADFIIKQTGVGAQINSHTGKSLNSIITYLKSQVKDKANLETAVPHAFEYLFTYYDRWDKFHKGQLKMNQIESNLINIINSIKNGNTLNQSKQQPSKYAVKR